MKRIICAISVFWLSCAVMLSGCSSNTLSSADAKDLAIKQAQQHFITDISEYQWNGSSQSSSYSSQAKDFSQFQISDVSLTHNNSYMIVEGSVKNSGSATRKFVKVKASFKDKNGNVIDTDDTYACGDEGLEPGESTKFKIYVDYDQRIQQVSTRIYDYD